MRVFRGFHHRDIAPACALTIGNFDGVHRGHQAMLALLISEAKHRGVPASVLTFEPHPRDFFAQMAGKPELAPGRIANLRDKLTELERCGIDQTIVLRFDRRLASLSPQAFIDDVLVRGLNARYVLVGDDFRFGAKRAGDYAMLDAAGEAAGFDVARMNSYEVHGVRVSSSAVREALARGDMERAASLLGRPYSISGHVQHGRKLGRELGFPTLNLRFHYPRPAAVGVFFVLVHGLSSKCGSATLLDPSGAESAQPSPAALVPEALEGVASLGRRPTVEDAGRVLLEVFCLDWALQREAGYGRIVRVELLHKLRDEERYPTLAALRERIALDAAEARAWFDARRRKPRRVE